MEVTLDIPVVSLEWRRDEGEEEERIRTEEQVVRQKEEPRGQIFVCIQGHWESEKRHGSGDPQSSHQGVRLHQPSHIPSCPGPGEWQGRRGGKSHDAYTGMTHSIVGYGL